MVDEVVFVVLPFTGWTPPKPPFEQTRMEEIGGFPVAFYESPVPRRMSEEDLVREDGESYGSRVFLDTPDGDRTPG